MKLFKSLAARAMLAGAALTLTAAPTLAQTVYQIPSLSDFSGPFASVMPAFSGGREAVFSWWNAEHGAKLGVKLELKPYDTRYDTAQTASLWPGILATKPIIGFSLGGPDTAALQQRLPTDKVPMILGSAANGFGWRPNQWVMSVRPTFVHELAAFVEWYQKTKVGGTRPVKVAMFTTEASPTFADMGKGIVAYAKAKPAMIELVEVVYVDPQPADLTLQLRRVLNAGAEVVLVPGPIQHGIAVKRAMQALNKKIPLVYSMHNSISVLERPLGGIAALEGDYEAYSLAIAGADESDAKRFYDLLSTKHGLKAAWNSFSAIGIAQALVLVRSVEAGARKYGGDKLTGDLMYQTLTSTHFAAKDFFGYVGGDVDFSVEAPFPLRDPRVNIGQVNGGKLTTIATGVPVPKLEKW